MSLSQILPAQAEVAIVQPIVAEPSVQTGIYLQKMSFKRSCSLYALDQLTRAHLVRLAFHFTGLQPNGLRRRMHRPYTPLMVILVLGTSGVRCLFVVLGIFNRIRDLAGVYYSKTVNTSIDCYSGS